jgi:L-asparaginase
MSILVITTGGTIGAMPCDDPTSCPPYVTMPPDGRDLVREALTRDFSSMPIRCVSAEHRDSKNFDDAYRNNLTNLIDAAPETRFLVTHGTDTILETAEYFYNKMESGKGLKGKFILLTGAMLPLSNGPESDGYLNLKFSLEQLAQDRIGHGIYIVLCDYIAPETRTGWSPRLYRYESGAYEKYYDPVDSRFSRIRKVGAMGTQ